jgi:hypothetical protein
VQALVAWTEITPPKIGGMGYAMEANRRLPWVSVTIFVSMPAHENIPIGSAHRPRIRRDDQRRASRHAT